MVYRILQWYIDLLPLRFIYIVTLFPLQWNILPQISHYCNVKKSDLCYLNVKNYHFNCITALKNILPHTFFQHKLTIVICVLLRKYFYFHISVGYLKEVDTRVLNCHDIKAVFILKICFTLFIRNIFLVFSFDFWVKCFLRNHI